MEESLFLHFMFSSYYCVMILPNLYKKHEKENEGLKLAWPSLTKYGNILLQSLPLTSVVVSRDAGPEKASLCAIITFYYSLQTRRASFTVEFAIFRPVFFGGNSGQYSAQNMQWPDYTRWYKACLKQEYIHIFSCQSYIQKHPCPNVSERPDLT